MAINPCYDKSWPIQDSFVLKITCLSISFLCCVRSRVPPTVDRKGPRSRQQALKSQILMFIRFLHMCFQTWDNLYVVKKMFVGYALTPSLTSSADPWQQFQESNARSSFSEWNRMKSIPDLHVFVSWPFLFVETGNCKDNNQELINANNKEF